VWGPDAKAWRPARWTDGGLPEAVKSVPGVFGNVMSFIGGAHGCIGYKFSLYEYRPPPPMRARR
jgi:cytochrome P450